MVCEITAMTEGCVMKDLLDTIAKALVDDPTGVNINQVESESSVVLELRVAREDMGKVIGKQGRIAKSIRTIMKAAAVKENKRINVEIID